MHDPITIDFETEAIVGNPIVNPPKPVGVAIWIPGQEPQYLAWGHPTGNTHDESTVGEYLGKLAQSGRPLLFHNAGFDLSVWNRWFIRHRFEMIGKDYWSRIHDTMYLLFLADPYAPTLSLKPSADRYLGMAPDEQSDVTNWVLANIAGATKKTAGAYISKAPVELVSRYAIGDVVRTRHLFDLLHAKIVNEGMEAAYDRERRLFPLVYGGTCRGIRVDRDTLDHHTNVYTKCLSIAEERLAGRLGISVPALDSDESLADGLEKSGAVVDWTLTKTGKRSMSKENLKITMPDVKILMDYRSGLSTCLQTFMRPWLEFSKYDGRLHPNWNQVKQMRGDSFKDKKGTQTGRLSSDSPNFQNVPTQFTDLTGQPLPVPEGLHPLPQLRVYCLPEPGHVWLKRDFSSQEIRILAHFEDGSLCEAYRADPSLDPHEMARQIAFGIVGVLYARKDIKITGFSIIYGSGVNGLSGQLHRPYHEAYEIKEAYLAAMPGIRDLMRDVQRRGKSGQPIRTWGGRVYFAEPSKEVDGRVWDFSYKLLNYLIQGSAADQTKESLCQWYSDRDTSRTTIFLATVHDEINISAPQECWKEEMKFLKECMNADRFDVPMLSEGFVGPNWCELESCE
jgi:DNA polymerase I-like protein with 3'-5' exonuclease and polymerase domains